MERSVKRKQQLDSEDVRRQCPICTRMPRRLMLLRMRTHVRVYFYDNFPRTL